MPGTALGTEDIGMNCVNGSVMSDSLRPHGLWPTRLLVPWNSPGKNTGVGSHSLLQRIFLTQGSNLGLPHSRQIPYCLSHQGSPTNEQMRLDSCFHRTYIQMGKTENKKVSKNV